MPRTMWRKTTLLVAVTLISKASVNSFDTDYNKLPFKLEEGSPKSETYVETFSDEEYIRQIYSMVEPYRGRVVVETSAQVDTKYRAWKRNADVINSLLGLPKGMNDAGR